MRREVAVFIIIVASKREEENNEIIPVLPLHVTLPIYCSHFLRRIYYVENGKSRYGSCCFNKNPGVVIPTLTCFRPRDTVQYAILTENGENVDNMPPTFGEA
jgi:hypothetical protein